MRSPLIFAAVGGVLVGTNAWASVIEYTNLDGARVAAWTDAPCDALASAEELKPKCVDSLDEVSKSAIGPAGGVLLARVGEYAFEVNPATGGVYRATVKKGDRGEVVVAKDFITVLKLPAGRRLRTLVTARIAQTDFAAALVNGKTSPSTRTLVTLSFVVGRATDDFETFELSYDVETLQASVTPRTIKVPSYEPPLTGWY